MIQWMKTVSSTVGCIPIYWKRFAHSWKNGPALPYCSTFDDYKKMNYYIHNRWKAATQYDPPCEKMTVLCYVNIRRPFNHKLNERLDQMQELLLKIPYKTDEYEKITDKRLFNSESLFSQVGGLIGIILGVSFLQIPDIYP